MEWYCKPFDALTASELYAILSARSEVFVVEQRCVYLDPDGKDTQAHHLFAMDGVGGVDGAQGLPRLAAYMRLLPPGVSYAEASIGRVLTGTAYRGRGIGQELLNKGLLHANRFWPNAALRIGAQAYLQKLYESAGFATVGEPYDEDGIPHIEMVRRIHH